MLTQRLDKLCTDASRHCQLQDAAPLPAAGRVIAALDPGRIAAVHSKTCRRRCRRRSTRCRRRCWLQPAGRVVAAAVGCNLQDALPPPLIPDASPPPLSLREEFPGRFRERFHGVGDDFSFPCGLEGIGVYWAGKFLTPGLTECINGDGLKFIPVGLDHGV
jgi:hypothetical protein